MTRTQLRHPFVREMVERIQAVPQALDATRWSEQMEAGAHTVTAAECWLSIYGTKLDEDGNPSRRGWRLPPFVDVLVHLVLVRLVCAVVGHDLVDLDPGDPEVGPQPDVVCRRCDCC